MKHLWTQIRQIMTGQMMNNNLLIMRSIVMFSLLKKFTIVSVLSGSSCKQLL